MSRFLSPKYLRYRKGGAPIEGDVHCKTCGYNLRGLITGRNCPECGNPTSHKASAELHDVMLAGGEESRLRWSLGLALIAFALVAALVIRVGSFIVGAPGVTDELRYGRLGANAVNSVLWIIGVFLVTPAVLVVHWPWMRTPRLLARFFALAFVPGYLCALARVSSPGGGTLELLLVAGDLGFRFLGAVGVLFVAFMLSWTAEEAELQVPARRIELALWLLWIPTLLAQSFPARIEWYTLVPLGLILFFWSWLVVLFALGVLAMRRHVRWAARLAAESIGRDARIDAKRRELQAESERDIRPLPTSSYDDAR